MPEPAVGDRELRSIGSPRRAQPRHRRQLRGWEAIDAAEKGKGEPLGRPRVKFCRIDEMVEASRSQAAGVGFGAATLQGDT